MFTFVLVPMCSSVYSVAFSFDAKYVVSGSEDYTAKVWLVSEGKCMMTMKEHTKYVACVRACVRGCVCGE